MPCYCPRPFSDIRTYIFLKIWMFWKSIWNGQLYKNQTIFNNFMTICAKKVTFSAIFRYTQKTVVITMVFSKNRPIFIKLAISDRQDFAIFITYRFKKKICKFLWPRTVTVHFSVEQTTHLKKHTLNSNLGGNFSAFLVL